jgi:hypothetical protein
MPPHNKRKQEKLAGFRSASQVSYIPSNALPRETPRPVPRITTGKDKRTPSEYNNRPAAAAPAVAVRERWRPVELPQRVNNNKIGNFQQRQVYDESSLYSQDYLDQIFKSTFFSQDVDPDFEKEINEFVESIDVAGIVEDDDEDERNLYAGLASQVLEDSLEKNPKPATSSDVSHDEDGPKDDYGKGKGSAIPATIGSKSSKEDRVRPAKPAGECHDFIPNCWVHFAVFYKHLENT